jgi:hypothetical protein
VAGLPRRALVAIGLLRPRSAKTRPDDVSRFEAALSRLAGTEELLETRFAEMREWQSRLFAENADQVTDLAERMDFLERVLAQQHPVPHLKAGEKKKATPTQAGAVPLTARPSAAVVGWRAAGTRRTRPPT